MVTIIPQESQIPGGVPANFQAAIDFYEDVVYDIRPDGKGKLDIYRPSNAPSGMLPTLIYIHGGGFVAGDKSAIRRSAFANIIKTCMENGIQILSINYTLTNKPYDDLGITRAMNSIGDAIAHIKLSADILRVDVNNIGGMGSSAGAYAAMWYSMKERGFQDGGISDEVSLKLKFGLGFKPNATMNLFRVEELGLLGTQTLDDVLEDPKMSDNCRAWFGILEAPTSREELSVLPALDIMWSFDPYAIDVDGNDSFTSSANPYGMIINSPDEEPDIVSEYVHNPANGENIWNKYNNAGASCVLWGIHASNPVISLPIEGRPGIYEWLVNQFN